jgi:hypothetical protein
MTFKKTEALAPRRTVTGTVRKIDHNPINDALANYQFAHEMKIGDYVFIKKEQKRLSPTEKSFRIINMILHANSIIPFEKWNGLQRVNGTVEMTPTHQNIIRYYSI